MTVHLIDVSNFQPTVDFAQVKAAGFDAAWIKASEGTTYTDPSLVAHSQDAARAGVLAGYYHFCRPDLGTSPEDEADHFYKVVGDVPPGTLLAPDIEVGSGDLSEWALRFCARAKANFTMPRLRIYTGGWFSRDKLTDKALSAELLWDSSYTGMWPQTFAPWPFIDMWQYTDHAWVPGVGSVDASLYLGSLEALRATGKPGPVPAPVPAPTPPTPPHPAPAPAPAPGSRPPYPTAATYRVTGEHFLRLLPRGGAPHAEVAIAAVGDILGSVAAPAGLPRWTTSWRFVKHQKTGAVGYASAPHLAAAS
jgi:GH25 family lysozyme M1 (1,4-beta-N-acetylmuramidase)